MTAKELAMMILEYCLDNMEGCDEPEWSFLCNIEIASSRYLVELNELGE